MVHTQKLRTIEIITIAAARRTAQRVVVEKVVRHHFEAQPVDQGDAGATAAAHLVVGIGRLMVRRSEIPQHNAIPRPS